jgi:hypothetical protein
MAKQNCLQIVFVAESAGTTVLGKIIIHILNIYRGCSMVIEIPEHNDAVVSLISVEVTGKCGHTWTLNISGGYFPDGWYVCRTCWQPHKHDEYQYTKIQSKYPFLNHG